MPAATKDTAATQHTACICPVCGAPAEYDLAPNPGPAEGGEHAPPFPPPEGMNPPPDPLPEAEYGPWYLVVCSTNVHRFLCPESRLDMLELPPPPGKQGMLPTVGRPLDRMQGGPAPAPKKHEAGHEHDKATAHPAPHGGHDKK